ncbi:ATP-binding protein [Myxococcota bacterium]
MTQRLRQIPSLKEKVRRLEIAHHLSMDREEKADIEQAISCLYLKHFDINTDQPSFDATGADVSIGDFHLGEIVCPDGGRQPYHLRSSEMQQHLGVFGRSGAGKTNSIFHLLKELRKKGLPFLLTDWKNDYSDVDWQGLFTGISQQGGAKPVHILPVGRKGRPGFQFNPLIPPSGVEPTLWVARITDVISNVFMGGPRFDQLIREGIDHVYHEFGVYKGSPERYPTLDDLRHHFETKKPRGREANWLQSVQNTLSSLCFGGTGETLNVPTQPPLDFLIHECVVLELSALNNAAKAFIIDALLLWLQQYLLQQPPARGLRSVVLLEEAHHLLRDKQESEETIIDVVLREVRSLGVGVVVIDQMPSLISKVALANTYTTLALNLKLGDCKNKIARCMGLNPEQKEALGDLPVGSAVVKMQDRHAKPFILKIPLVEVPRLRRDSIPRSPYARDPNSTVFRAESTVSARGDRISRIPPAINNNEEMESHSTDSTSFEPKLEMELTLLNDIIKYPTSTVVERYDRIGLSRRKGNLAKKYLEREGLIEGQIIRAKNSWVKLLKATPEGEDILSKRGISSPPRHGGLEHQYWIAQIAAHLSNELGTGADIQKEHAIGGGRTVDIAVIEDGKVTAVVEVETGKSDLAANITKCQQANIPIIITALTSKALLDKTKQELAVASNVRLITTQEALSLTTTSLQS